MQTRSERKVEPSPRIFRPAVCRVVSQTTWTGLAVAAQCLAFGRYPSAATPGRAEFRDALRCWDGVPLYVFAEGLGAD